MLFQNGTCVVLMQPEVDLAAQATAIVRKWGPVHAGSYVPPRTSPEHRNRCRDGVVPE